MRRGPDGKTKKLSEVEKEIVSRNVEAIQKKDATEDSNQKAAERIVNVLGKYFDDK